MRRQIRRNYGLPQGNVRDTVLIFSPILAIESRILTVLAPFIPAQVRFLFQTLCGIAQKCVQNYIQAKYFSSYCFCFIKFNLDAHFVCQIHHNSPVFTLKTSLRVNHWLGKSTKLGKLVAYSGQASRHTLLDQNNAANAPSHAANV
jgi:hypothetical protein